MSATTLPWQGSASDRTGRAGTRIIAQVFCAVIAGVALTAFWTDTPWALWFNILPALWLSFRAPHILVSLLLLVTPTFPVLKVVDETLGSRDVSTRGLFLSADDPIIAALVIAWAWRRLNRSASSQPLFPSAFLGLAALYPAVIAVNMLRLDWQQSVMSFLYYLKWAEYAALLFIIPALIRRDRIASLLSGFRMALFLGAVASAALAVYEMTESIRMHTYSQAALYPRASSFFGSLDPGRFGASEDPVNFGCYLIVSGSIALAFSTQVRTAAGGTVAALASFLGVLMSVSRAPILGAAFAYARLQKLRAGKTLLSLLGLIAAAGLGTLLFPDIAESVITRFTMIVPAEQATEGSASDRLLIALNSPVFEVDAFWLFGHGHSSYRFISAQHLSSFIGGISRSLYNFPMTVWYDVGAAGLALWIAAYIQLSGYLRRLSNRSHEPAISALAEGLRAALFGLLIASMFSEVPYNWRVMGFFYNATGVCLAASRSLLPSVRRLC